jgi:hypothetical protein
VCDPLDREHKALDDVRERRGGCRAVQGVAPEVDAPLVGREQEVAPAPEALDQRRRRQPHLRRDRGEGQARRADAVGEVADIDPAG